MSKEKDEAVKLLEDLAIQQENDLVYREFGFEDLEAVFFIGIMFFIFFVVYPIIFKDFGEKKNE